MYISDLETTQHFGWTMYAPLSLIAVYVVTVVSQETATVSIYDTDEYNALRRCASEGFTRVGLTSLAMELECGTDPTYNQCKTQQNQSYPAGWMTDAPIQMTYRVQ